MPKPRKQQIVIDATSYYHCTSRCVRRAFLCGTDTYSGKSYEHRRGWVEQRIHQLATVFCIDVCAYAVMSNHLHLVLRVNKEDALKLSSQDACRRWHRIFKGTPLSQRYISQDSLSMSERVAVEDTINMWRERLYSISWFMRCLNEPIARQANTEDQCTGSFWEGRFSCNALLDEKALAACLAYVDLNPIRAGIASTLAESNHTSIKRRIKSRHCQPDILLPFTGNSRLNGKAGIPFELDEYLRLLEWTMETLRKQSLTKTTTSRPSFLKSLNFSQVDWLQLVTKFESKVPLIVGDTSSIEDNARYFGYQRKPRKALRLLSSPSV